MLHYLEQWKAEHAGTAPDDYKEKAAFRDMVRQGMRTSNAEGGEENWEEAVGAVLKSLNPPTPSGAVREVLAAPEAINLNQKVVIVHI